MAQDEVKGSFGGWHLFSTNQSKRTLSGVTANDVVSIINGLMSKHKLNNIDALSDLIHEHITKRDNPHHVTPEQLPKSVLEALYELWLEEGKLGDIDYMSDVVFQYTNIADWETMLEGLDENTAVPIKIVMDYLLRHDALIDAHSNIIDGLVPGESFTAYPLFAIERNIGIVSELKQTDMAQIPYLVLDKFNSSRGTLVLEGEHSLKSPATAQQIARLELDGMNYLEIIRQTVGDLARVRFVTGNMTRLTFDVSLSSTEPEFLLAISFDGSTIRAMSDVDSVAVEHTQGFVMPKMDQLYLADNTSVYLDTTVNRVTIYGEAASGPQLISLTKHRSRCKPRVIKNIDDVYVMRDGYVPTGIQAYKDAAVPYKQQLVSGNYMLSINGVPTPTFVNIS